MIFLLLSIGFIQVLQLEAALTPGNIPSQAAYCVASAAPRAVNNSFSYESFAAQGVQLPPCDEAQARLWQNMLLDPELQGEQSGSNWTKYALPAAGLGAAGTTAVYNYWKLRKAREEAAERYQPEQIVPHQTPTQPNPVPEGVIIPSTDTIPTQTPLTFSPTTRWWKKCAYVITTAFAVAGFGGTKLAHPWNQTTTDVGAHELAVRNRPTTTTANIETQQVVVNNQTITNAATQELVVSDRRTTEQFVLQNRPTRINIATQTDPDGPTEAQQLLVWNPPTTFNIETQTDLHRSTINVESQTEAVVPPLNLYAVTSHDQNPDAVITSRTGYTTDRNRTMSTSSFYGSPRRTKEEDMEYLRAEGFNPFLNEKDEIMIPKDEWERYTEFMLSAIHPQDHKDTRLPVPIMVDCETQYSPRAVAAEERADLRDSKNDIGTISLAHTVAETECGGSEPAQVTEYQQNQQRLQNDLNIRLNAIKKISRRLELDSLKGQISGLKNKLEQLVTENHTYRNKKATTYVCTVDNWKGQMNEDDLKVRINALQEAYNEQQQRITNAQKEYLKAIFERSRTA